MSVYIMVGGKPLPGRFNEAETRMRTIAGVMAQKDQMQQGCIKLYWGTEAGRLSLVAGLRVFMKQ